MLLLLLLVAVVVVLALLLLLWMIVVVLVVAFVAVVLVVLFTSNRHLWYPLCASCDSSCERDTGRNYVVTDSETEKNNSRLRIMLSQ